MALKALIPLLSHSAIILLAPFSMVYAQTYLYFQDSPHPDYYEYSWMELTPPSELERKIEPELRRFPVESVITPLQGINSLRLKWRSMTGGSWVAIAAGDSWTAKDISNSDTLEFWLHSIEGIEADALPEIFMEDVTNKKSVFLPISDFHGDLQAGLWTRITVSMGSFLNSGDQVDYTRIKTIGFAQGADDGVQHTLLIDNMRVNTGDGTAPPVSEPQNVTVTPYEYHFEVSWDPNPEEEIAGYQVERSVDGGSTFSPVALVGESQFLAVDWVKQLGETVQASYRVKALNKNFDPSAPSSVVSSETRSMSDDELLDMVQRYTFRYFWDFAHEASGMARERNKSGNTVTSGGSGFGIMAIPVGIERGYITREEGAARTLKILNFLDTAERFHGVWSHWINGNTGKAIPFSTKDNGGDIVETAYMAQGLLTIRKYFTNNTPGEKEIVRLATELWEGIEWDWYRKDDSPSIYWHWSPDYNWQMNMTVTGWNEAAIVYLLAVSSPSHGVPASLWHSGWAKNSGYLNGDSFYGHKLHVGKDYGGPLFFAHYSFLGFDPRDKTDGYTNYFDHNRNHSLVQQAYCEENPKGFAGYSAVCWGLTASDDPDGYLAHEPNSSRDNGTITPTAALSSFPYTPEESMMALKHFYRELGSKTWDWMGFKDAFNLQRDWYADSYLAIDQGPIILMIENYRSQLLWDLFMSNSEIQSMMDSIGFVYGPNPVREPGFNSGAGLSVFPNPSGAGFTITFAIEQAYGVELDLYNLAGVKVLNIIQNESYDIGTHSVVVNANALNPGIYMARMGFGNGFTRTIKIIVK